jgi:hypothetical protein
MHIANMDIAMKADLDQWLAQARHDRRRGCR